MSGETCPHQETTVGGPPKEGAASPASPPSFGRKVLDWILGRPVSQRTDQPSESDPTDVPNPSTSDLSKSRFLEIGWLVDTKASEFIWDAPRPISRRLGKPETPKAVQKCPAILDFDKRFFVVPAPVDLHIGITRDPKGKWVLVNKAGPSSPIYPKKVNELVHITPQDQWRHRDKPVIQISAPYRFVADEPVWMYQMPPFLHYGANAWPGLLITGRLPVHIWPRILMWAFEWHEPEKDLIIRRGEPWFFVHFQTEDVNRPIRLVHAQMTPELRQYCAGTDGVTNYVNQTYSLFDVAEQRRPKKLLTPFEAAHFGSGSSSEGA